MYREKKTRTQLVIILKLNNPKATNYFFSQQFDLRVLKIISL